jgi:hypothetical protein
VTKWTAALLAISGLLACATIIEPTPASDFEEICQTLDIDCSGFPPPIVVVTQLVPGGYYGLYIRGEPYIFISSEFSLDQIQKTKYHEMVHYIQVNDNPEIGRCESEETARKLTSIKFGFPYDEDWRDYYRC